MKKAEMEKRIEKVVGVGVGVGVGVKKLKHNIHPGVKKKGKELAESRLTISGQLAINNHHNATLRAYKKSSDDDASCGDTIMNSLEDYPTVIDVVWCLSKVVTAFKESMIILCHDVDRCGNFTHTLQASTNYIVETKPPVERPHGH